MKTRDNTEYFARLMTLEELKSRLELSKPFIFKNICIDLCNYKVEHLEESNWLLEPLCKFINSITEQKNNFGISEIIASTNVSKQTEIKPTHKITITFENIDLLDEFISNQNLNIDEKDIDEKNNTITQNGSNNMLGKFLSNIFPNEYSKSKLEQTVHRNIPRKKDFSSLKFLPETFIEAMQAKLLSEKKYIGGKK